MNGSIRTVLILFCVFSAASCKKTETSVAPENKPAFDSDYFTVELYDGLSAELTARVLQHLDDNYSRILGDLNVSSIPKIKIEIWNDESHFQSDMKNDIGVNYWGSTGYVYNMTTVRVLNRGDVAQTALHEFAHVVSLYVNRQFGNNPRWYWEAVALFESGEFFHPKNISYLSAGNFPSIAELNSDYNTGSRKIYEVGYLISEYVLSKWGKDSYIKMIKLSANIQSVLGITVTEFEAGWKDFVVQKYLSASS